MVASLPLRAASSRSYMLQDAVGVTSGIAVNLETFVAHDEMEKEQEQKRGGQF